MPQVNLGNGYEIDLADGWTFVHALQDSLLQLEEGWQANCANLVIRPPGNDGHSHSFSQEFTQKAIDQHTQWYNAKIKQFNSMVQNMTGILQQYGVTETANTIQWGAADTSSPVGNFQGKGGGRGAS